ncbi:MAG: Pr6Pr family membrane protein [Clostridia bacterium]|nr:Pr6Pr family membrane protein [Clostridia bacterium]
MKKKNELKEEESAITADSTVSTETTVSTLIQKDVICDNLLTQAIYRIIFCVISGLACILSLKFFTNVTDGTAGFTISHNFWQYYTNLSNYYCFGIGIAVCASTIKKLRRGEKTGYNTCAPTLKFCGVVMIMVTFLVYNCYLGKPSSLNFWNSLGNISYHVVAPILFIVDFFIFDKHKQIKILDPIKATFMPLGYVVYILIYGAICRAANLNFEYPYPFLNVDKLGYGGVIGWIAMLVVAFIAVGYLLFLYDKLVKKDGKWKLDFTNLKLW